MKLQFKHQRFQKEAAAAVCDVFSGQPKQTAAQEANSDRWSRRQQELGAGADGWGNAPLAPELTAAALLKNVQAVQRRNGLRPAEALEGPGINLSVEMETGTGKTYTYVKTIYELNARYGWSKFIIVVPSVAIREGVYQSLQTTQEHFAEDYGKKIRFFVYQSDRLKDVEDFAADSSIHVMIINMQAFNSSKNQRVIDKKTERFRNRTPMEIIASMNPILVIDEPQSVEGKQTKECLKKFHALFTLRYSATHKERYTMVYRLDAVDAYHQHLVKKIAAIGITITDTAASGGYVCLEGVDTYPDRAPTARLGFERKGSAGVRTVVKKLGVKADLFEESHHLEEYSDGYQITEIDGRDHSVTFRNGRKLYPGQMQGNEQREALQRRMQIRETIRTHLERERELYGSGVKVLSLFFVDEVAKYRLYDGDHGDGRNGEYAQMFEEEYRNVVDSFLAQDGDSAYGRYLRNIDVRSTHQGYFSVDRKKGHKARFVESKIHNKKKQTTDDTDAYDLIMRDKERLLRLEEPVRFLFSHSALREGWDNPNVFQICTLKPQSASEVRSRQEIGRGLRLCVNQQGERMDESVLGKDVQRVNKLTLITDLSFRTFAQALQSGLAESMRDRPQKVDGKLFTGRCLTNAAGQELPVTAALAEVICRELVRHGYVQHGELTERYYDDKENGLVRVAEEVQDYADAVVQILSSIYDPRAMQIEDALREQGAAEADEERRRRREVQTLWERISRKSTYTVSLDTPTLIRRAVDHLQRSLAVTTASVKKEYGEQTACLTSQARQRQGQGFHRTKEEQQAVSRLTLGSSKYDLLGKLVEETGLTRGTVAAILCGIPPETFAMFRVNPEEFLLKTAQIINRTKADIVVEHIVRRKSDGTYRAEITAMMDLCGTPGSTGGAAEAWDGLREGVDQPQGAAAPVLYSRLPRSFRISTPTGRYAPDWALAWETDTYRHIYLVAESKDTPVPEEGETLLATVKAQLAGAGSNELACRVIEKDEELLRLLSGGECP